MCPPWAAPPAADPCLDLPDIARKKKGGTIIQALVTDFEEHECWLSQRRYRPPECPHPKCRARLHSHGTRTRSLKGALGTLAMLMPPLVILIAVYRCAGCGAIWRVLPGFVPRWLHSPWSVIDEAVGQGPSPASARVPPRTRRRWAARLCQSSRKPVQVLATSGEPLLRQVACAIGLQADRASLLLHWSAVFAGRAFASVAERLHRMMPGIRLM